MNKKIIMFHGVKTKKIKQYLINWKLTFDDEIMNGYTIIAVKKILDYHRKIIIKDVKLVYECDLFFGCSPDIYQDKINVEIIHEIEI